MHIAGHRGPLTAEGGIDLVPIDLLGLRLNLGCR